VLTDSAWQTFVAVSIEWRMLWVAMKMQAMIRQVANAARSDRLKSAPLLAGFVLTLQV
jgi:hypothetical protein